MGFARSARRAAAIAIAAALAALVPQAFAAAGATTATIASLRLSPADLYDGLAVVSGRLILFGSPDSYPGLPSASFSAGPRFSPPVGCHSAVVDPATLTLSDEQTAGCDDPRLYGVDVLPLNFVDNGTPLGSNVRIVHATADGGYAIGPVVMTYSEYSDTDAEWVYGDGYLWLFDPTTSHGSELLRISQSTGAVLQTIHMPWVDRPLIAADDDGFWIAAATNSGFNRASVGGLYRVAPGRARPILVRKIHWDAYWMVAAGHSLWIDVDHGGKSATLLRFDRTSTKPVLRVTSRSAVGGEYGYNETTVAGDAADGIWTVLPQMPLHTQQRVMRIDPDTGRPSQVASVTPPGYYYAGYASPPEVVLDGSLFFLDPPAVSFPTDSSTATVKGPSALFRVTPTR